MKAVIVDIEGKYAVVLDKKGSFIKVRNNGRFQVGCEIDVPSKLKSFSVLAKTASIAAAFLFVMGIGVGVYSYSIPYSYINIDINPSVEITSNIYDRIIGIQGINEDGIKLIGIDSYKNKTIEAGVENVIKKAAEKGYLKESLNNAIMLTVSSKNGEKASDIEKQLKTTSSKELNTENIKAKVITQKVSVQKRNDAKSIGVSPGKLALIEKLKKVDPAQKVEDLKNTPVRDIIQLIDDKKKENKNGSIDSRPKGKEKTGKKEPAAKEQDNGKGKKSIEEKVNGLDTPTPSPFYNKKEDKKANKASGKNTGKNKGKNSGTKKEVPTVNDEKVDSNKQSGKQNNVQSNNGNNKQSSKQDGEKQGNKEAGNGKKGK